MSILQPFVAHLLHAISTFSGIFTSEHPMLTHRISIQSLTGLKSERLLSAV
ncbi:MAG: hypothetical protein J1D86_07025 [Alistipes sp.]|nr:hypothetical protein [Alistipes sp.]